MTFKKIVIKRVGCYEPRYMQGPDNWQNRVAQPRSLVHPAESYLNKAEIERSSLIRREASPMSVAMLTCSIL